MRRLLVAISSAVLALGSGAHAEPLAQSRASGPPSNWRWHVAATPNTTVQIDFIRADVTIVPSTDNRLVVTIVAEGPVEDAARLWIDVTEKDGAYVLTDRFPRRSMLAFPSECLPPPDERGDFWLVSSKLRVTVAAPSGWRPHISVKEGRVRDLRWTTMQRRKDHPRNTAPEEIAVIGS